MNTETQYPNIPMIAVESKQIAAIGHQDTTLAIQFRGHGDKPGAVYHYPNFSAEDFDKFKTAESLGLHFTKHIKTRTEYVHLPESA
jgi:hypothetical protein